MEELLKLRERVEIAIEIGESYYREFKSALEGPSGNKTLRDTKAVCSDIAKTLVAFANADGGELFVIHLPRLYGHTRQERRGHERRFLAG